MADRLTWQNVNAPDLSGSAQALAVAGRLLGDGFNGIGTALEGRADRQNNEMSAAAIAAAQRYTTAEQWDKAMSELGVGGALGVDPSKLNADALKIINDQRTALLDNAGTRASTGLTVAQTGAAEANTDYTRAQIGWGNTENADLHASRSFDLNQGMYTFDRTKAGHAEEDAAKAIDKEADAYIDKTAFGTIDPEQTRQAIINDQSLTSQQRRAYLTRFETDGAKFYTPTAQAAREVSDMSIIKNANATLGNFQNDKLMTQAADPTYQAWVTAQGQYGNSGNPFQQMMTDLEEYNGKLQSENGETPVAFTTSAGRIRDSYDTAKAKFPNVPESVIAGVLADHVKRGYLLLGDGQELKIDEKSAWKVLDEFNDPQKQATLKSRQQASDFENQTVTTLTGDISAASQRLAIAKSKGLTAEIKKSEEELAKLTDKAEQFVKQRTGQPAADTGSDIPEAAQRALSAASAGKAPAPIFSPNFNGAAQPLPANAQLDPAAAEIDAFLASIGKR